MRDHVRASKILAATGTGSVLAAVLTSSALAVGNALNGADGIGFLFVVGLIVGIPVAIIVGVPVGFVLSWVVGLTGPPSQARAIAAGGITAVSLISVAIVTDFIDSDSLSQALLWLGGAWTIGSMSGLAAHLLHFRQRLDS